MEQNLLFEVLRILTLEEIAELATSSEVAEKYSLTEMMDKRLESKSSEAKILPFDREEKEEEETSLGRDDEIEEEEMHQTEAAEVVDEQVEEDADVFKLSDMFKVEEVVEEEKVDTTKFILEEKERFKKSRRDLKGKEILKLYQSNAAVSVEQEKKNKKNLSKSTHSGVLVNKKQA